MANRTDPLIAQVSGSDPQNLMEYITRQKIYDSRFWKESCFGLTVSDVLEKAVDVCSTVGGLPTHFLSLTLKLLQLHPETDLIVETFVEQDDFKYVRALGAFYIRLTADANVVYQTLEPLYADRRKLRYWASPQWSLLHMDEFVHQLLTETQVVGITLPRLPARHVLEDAGYLEEAERANAPEEDDNNNEDAQKEGMPPRRPPPVVPRPTALKDVLLEYGGPLAYLEHKALTEQCPAALAMWRERQERNAERTRPKKKARTKQVKESEVVEAAEKDGASPEIARQAAETTMQSSSKEMSETREAAAKRPKKKARNYDNLFKKSKSGPSSNSKAASSSSSQPASNQAPDQDSSLSTEYWNEQREKLGLKPLKEKK